MNINLSYVDLDVRHFTFSLFLIPNSNIVEWQGRNVCAEFELIALRINLQFLKRYPTVFLIIITCIPSRQLLFKSATRPMSSKRPIFFTFKAKYEIFVRSPSNLHFCCSAVLVLLLTIHICGLQVIHLEEDDGHHAPLCHYCVSYRKPILRLELVERFILMY